MDDMSESWLQAGLTGAILRYLRDPVQLPALAEVTAKPMKSMKAGKESTGTADEESSFSLPMKAAAASNKQALPVCC